MSARMRWQSFVTYSSLSTSGGRGKGSSFRQLATSLLIEERELEAGGLN